MNISFSPPDITELEISSVTEALRSGWITTGPKTKLFEQKIAEYCGTQKAVCLSSATASLELVLRWLDIGPGDEVITSAYTYTASASVIFHTGATIVLVDVEPDTFHIDYESLADAITERTKAVIPVDIGGVMVDYDRVFAAVESKRKLFKPSNERQALFGRPVVLADAAHSFGATYHGLRSGTAADFTCFSFHAVKNLTTAEGGAITWTNRDGLDNDEFYRWMMLYSLHGQSKDALSKTKPGAWEYDIVYPAYKCNMTDIAAALGLVQLQRFEGMLERRKLVTRIYDEKLLPCGIQRLAQFDASNTPGWEGNGHLYLARIPGADESVRNELIAHMAEYGVACNVHYKPLPMHTAYQRLGFDIADYPESYKQFRNEITLPLHSLLTDEEAAYVANTLCHTLKGGSKQRKLHAEDMSFVRVWDSDAKNIEAIYTILKECGEKLFLDEGLLHWADPMPISVIREACLDKEIYLVRSKRSGQALGMFSLSSKHGRGFSVDDTKALYLNRIAVSTEQWHRGVGRAMVEWAEKLSREAGCSCLRTTVYEKSLNAKAFFEAMGFHGVCKSMTKHFIIDCMEMDFNSGASRGVNANN